MVEIGLALLAGVVAYQHLRIRRLEAGVWCEDELEVPENVHE